LRNIGFAGRVQVNSRAIYGNCDSLGKYPVFVETGKEVLEETLGQNPFRCSGASAEDWFMACRKGGAKSPDTPIDGNVP